MAKTITLTVPHELSPDEVKRRLVSAIGQARADYPEALAQAQESWDGNRMEFSANAKGQSISGVVDIQPRQVTVAVNLPFVLGLFASKLRPRIEEEARRLLAP